jgi:hypothetical protein
VTVQPVLHARNVLVHCVFTLANVAWQAALPWHDLMQAIVHFCASLSFLQSFEHLLPHPDCSLFMQLAIFAWAGSRQSAKLRSQTTHSAENTGLCPKAKNPKARNSAVQRVRSNLWLVICIPSDSKLEKAR